MKKILLLAATTLGLTIAANAQLQKGTRKVNLQISVDTPKDNGVYEIQNDEFILSFAIKNAGTDSVRSQDIVTIATDAKWFTGADGTMYLGKPANATIAPNETVNWSITLKGGTQVRVSNGSSSENKTVSFPATVVIDTFTVFTYGLSVDAPDTLLFDEAEYIDDGSGNWNIGGDNVTGALNVTFNNPLSINAVNKATALNVYPNPTSTNISFSYDFNTSNNATVRIMDLMGRTLMTKDFGKQTVGTNNFTLDVATLSNGVYYVEMISGDIRGISKFTVSK